MTPSREERAGPAHWDQWVGGLPRRGDESPPVAVPPTEPRKPERKPSWARHQIGLLQLEKQREAIALALLEVELNLRPESNRQAYRARDELQRELLFLDEAKSVLEALPKRRRMPWSKTIVKLYQWSTAERLKLD